MNAKELKDLLTLEQIEYILSTIGAEPRVDYTNNIIHNSTVCHNGDSHKLVYYHKDQRFKCYTKCGKTFDIIGLVEHVLDISFGIFPFSPNIRFCTQDFVLQPKTHTESHTDRPGQLRYVQLQK